MITFPGSGRVAAANCQYREDVKHADSKDRQFLLSDLAFMLEEEARLGTRIEDMSAGLSSPYFSKVVSDEAIYISAISDPDYNLVKFTSPIAVLSTKTWDKLAMSAA